MKKNVTYLALCGLLVTGVWWQFGDIGSTTSAASVAMKPTESTLLSTKVTNVLPLTVSGVVEATDTVVVRAQTSGQVSEVLLKEGSQISIGERVVRIADPIVTAEYVRAAARTSLTAAELELQRAGASDSATAQSLQARTADEVARLVVVQGEVEVMAAYTELQNTLHSVVELVPRAAAYIDENRPLFTADGLQAHRVALTTIYGIPPSYFESVRYGSERDDSFIAQLPAALTDTPDPLILETLALELWVVLEQQSAALTTAESDVLSNDSILSGAEREAYFALRAEVRAAQSLLRSKIVTARTVERQVTTLQAESTAPVTVLAFQAAAAARQVALLESVVLARRTVADAEQGVAAAAATLLDVRAPVAGTVGGPLVSVGTYVTSGTPLFTLYGAGARELEVTVPIRLAPLVSTGQTFTVAGKTIGVVDRWVLSGGGVVSVTVQLSGEIPTGTLLTGTLELDLPEDWYALPTAALEHVHGAVVVYRGDEQVVVSPQYMIGDTWFVTSESGLPTQVERVGGMNLSRSK